MEGDKPLIKAGSMRAILFAVTFLVLIIIANKITDKLIENINPKNQNTGEIYNLSELFLPVRMIILLAISVLTVYFFQKKIDKQNLISHGFQLKNNLSHAVVGFALGLLLSGTGTFILIGNHNLQWTGIEYNTIALLTGFGVMVMVAFSEELVFRGYILSNLLLSMNKWMALIYSALIFTLFHISNPGINILAIVNIFLAGLLLGINYIFTKNLWYSLLFHFAWNFYQGSILGYKVSGISLQPLLAQQLTGQSIMTGGTFGFEGSVVTSVLTLISISLLAWTYTKRYEA